MVTGAPIVAALLRFLSNLQIQQESNNVEQELEALRESMESNAGEGNQGASIATKRAAQTVPTIAQRAQIAAWMKRPAEESGNKLMASKTVPHFPDLFRGSRNGNLQRAIRLWRRRADYEDGNGDAKYRGVTSSITRFNSKGLKGVRLKARSGPGGKRLPWLEAFHADLRSEFDWLRKLGVNFNLYTLGMLAVDLLSNTASQAYSLSMIDPR